MVRSSLFGALARLLIVVGLVFPFVAGGSSAAAQSGTSDIAIVTTDAGASYFDACYVLLSFSNEGCDANRDGQITFEDIPYGTYTLRQTRSLPGGRFVADVTITVNGAAQGDGWERFYVTVSGAPQAATSDVAIVTLQNGSSFYDACYVLVDYSQVGCDVNRDGKITFEDIPYGTYTLRQTNNLGGGRSVPDSTIRVTGAAGADGWERFQVNVVTSAPAAPAVAPVDIALITRDQQGKLVTDVCYELVGYSNIGCDENADGQTTFEAIPAGTYTVRQTKSPAGYNAVQPFDIYIPEGQLVDMGFLVKQDAVQNAPNTRNVSVVFVDSSTNTRVAGNGCVELVYGSNVGCDEDLHDGQVDFIDVPAGEYHVKVSRAPQGYSLVSQNLATIKVNAGVGQHTVVIYYVYVARSGATTVPQSRATGGYEAMVGSWYGKRRALDLNADGTAQWMLNQDAFGNGINVDLVVESYGDVPILVVTATAPYGNPDLQYLPKVGERFELILNQHPDGVTLQIRQVGDDYEWAAHYCNDALEGESNPQGLCY